MTDLRPAAVVDGCAMILRRQALEEIGIKPALPPTSFDDRRISCQVLERGWCIAVLGIACDHLGDETAGRQADSPALYLEAERQFLTEWRETKHFIPLRVLADGSVLHTG
jgi:ADP-ribose pyrophosphatase YjhB (NUDIX family)